MAAGVKWIQGSPQTFISSPSRIVHKFRERLYRRMNNVINEAVMDAKRFTATRPSAKSGKAGRVDTGLMMDSIVGRVWQDQREQIIGEFGFLNEQQLYFYLQTDTGFKHFMTGDFIEPTFALRDAAYIAFDKLLKSRV
jgi:hypothetical protein